MSMINFFNQYSYFFQKLYHDKRLNSQHVSLYLVLFYLWNKYRFPLYLYEYRNVIKQYSKIGSYSTYYKCLHDLSEWGYIVYFTGNEIGKKTKIQIVILEKPNGFSEELTLEFTDTDLYQQTPISENTTDTEKYQTDTKVYQADTDMYQYGYDSVSINRQTFIKTLHKDSFEKNENNNGILNSNLSITDTNEYKEKEKKVAAKKEKEIELPYTSEKFIQVWNELKFSPKWKKKSVSTINRILEKTKKYSEEFIIEQIEAAIDGSWQGLFYPETDNKYANWLKFKEKSHGNTESITDRPTRGTENVNENIQPQRDYKKRF